MRYLLLHEESERDSKSEVCVSVSLCGWVFWRSPHNSLGLCEITLAVVSLFPLIHIIHPARVQKKGGERGGDERGAWGKERRGEEMRGWGEERMG